MKKLTHQENNMHKIVTIFSLIVSALAIPHMASAQMVNELKFREAKAAMDRIFSTLPEKIECTNFVELRERHDHRDLNTKQATAQKYIFRLSNANFKFGGNYTMLGNDPSVVIYAMPSGGSDATLIVSVNDRGEGKLLAASPPLPQPNTCQAGMMISR